MSPSQIRLIQIASEIVGWSGMVLTLAVFVVAVGKRGYTESQRMAMLGLWGIMLVAFARFPPLAALLHPLIETNAGMFITLTIVLMAITLIMLSVAGEIRRLRSLASLSQADTTVSPREPLP